MKNLLIVPNVVMTFIYGMANVLKNVQKELIPVRMRKNVLYACLHVELVLEMDFVLLVLVDSI